MLRMSVRVAVHLVSLENLEKSWSDQGKVTENLLLPAAVVPQVMRWSQNKHN